MDTEKLRKLLTEVQAGRVRLGITAPKQVSIQRQEVHERIERERAGCVASADVADEPLLPVVEMEMPLPLQGPVAL